MTHVFQTRSGAKGNCFEACLASLLNLSITDVPSDLSQWDKIRAWLAPRGYRLAFRVADGKPLRRQTNPPRGQAIASLRLPDGAVHAVICRDGQIVHDPAVRPHSSDHCQVLLWTLLRKP